MLNHFHNDLINRHSTLLAYVRDVEQVRPTAVSHGGNQTDQKSEGALSDANEGKGDD